MNELRVRMRARERVLSLERELAECNRHLTAAYEQIRTDLDAAGRIQRSLLPERSLKLTRVEVEWSFMPSLFVLGDGLNFFRLDEEHVGFYNLDVAGHGVRAAMMSVMLSQMLSPSATAGLVAGDSDTSHGRLASPAGIVGVLNRQFQITAENSSYFTMVYGILDLETGIVRLVQAGHTNPILLSADGRLRPLTDGGPPVGVMPGTTYEEREIALLPGDRLFVYSDGITKCEDPSGSQFGETRLGSFLHASRRARLGESLRALEHELHSWRGQGAEGFLDDVSVLALQYR